MHVIEQHNMLFVCHECDALQNVTGIMPGNVASCVCCGTTLLKSPVSGIEKPLALAIASMILFLVGMIKLCIPHVTTLFSTTLYIWFYV
jgi:uncharacterized paraquat-inducible protein A